MTDQSPQRCTVDDCPYDPVIGGRCLPHLEPIRDYHHQSSGPDAELQVPPPTTPVAPIAHPTERDMRAAFRALRYAGDVATEAMRGFTAAWRYGGDD